MADTPTPAEDDHAGYAAYDKDLARFVGGVHRGKDAKAEAGKSDDAKDAKDAGHQVEVRQV